MFKKILVGLVGLLVLVVAVIVVAAFATPTDFRVERDITIDRPKAEVFDYMKMLKNQNDWGPWARKDPNIKQDYRGTDGTVGFVSSWNGTDDEVGEGEQEIKNIVDGERIDTELRFIRPFETKSNVWMITESAGADKTHVRWGFSGSMPRPMNLMLVVMDMDKQVGKDFEDGLSRLKSILESAQPPQ